MDLITNYKLGKIGAKGEIRIVELNTYTDGKYYRIETQTGVLNGKFTKGIPIPIIKGLQKRTIEEQFNLVLNRELNKYKTRGYKELTDGESYDTLSKISTDDSGIPKVMNAKQISDCKESILELTHYASPKLDGVRCFLLLENGEIVAKSRGGKNYTDMIPHIVNDSRLKIFFGKYPNYILDGEIYNHGLPLSTISGYMRSTVNQKEGAKTLKYFIYDLAIEKLSFEERLEILNFELGNVPSDSYEVLEQVKMSGKKNFYNYHDVMVGLGYEGIVIKAPMCEYGFDRRDVRCIKIKEYQDDEFLILGIKDGKRPEDLVFVLQTKEGKEFEAKPKGDRKLKQFYRDNIEDIKGKMGTVKYFNYSVHNIPTQPTFLAARDYE